jgi:divalent metal cation (Fe/Co/Zn/Cd) transporter
VNSEERQPFLARASRLECLTVGWNIVEGLVGVFAAVAAGSVALLGFGVDSFVESASGAVLLWRLAAERSARDHGEIEALDRKARKLVGLSLFLLAAFVAGDSAWTLWQREKPQPSFIGIGLTAVSIGVMWWLARAKRRVAHALGSRALEADSFQTTACFWLSIVVLCGVGLNAAFGWWWADPLAALGMTYFIVREGREAWRGEDECTSC